MNPSSHPQVSFYTQPILVQINQVAYDAQSSRRNISPPVEFCNAQTKGLGINLKDVLNFANFETLIDCPNDEILNTNVGQKLSYRLQFESQKPFAKQKYARTTGREIPVSRAKMARQVAEVVQAYFDERGFSSEDGHRYINIAPPERPQYLRLDQLYLTRVDHVTTGSLQPQLSVIEYGSPVPITSLPLAHAPAIQYL
ncbi:hypothetical protein BDY19DRAFT_996752 [Irpex rosettiformis]|uniref:Uncharacterized protein n=1 Tax=Irpex rosettiformis TaxID=378272 RepID=A0ACB8TU92_9APHY|nr:hypothetical protein BDY19DRAFT_996752 [Irpex rosettiformis]